MRGKRFESTAGPATLGTTAKAGRLLRIWCNRCRHWVDVDPGEQAARYGADLPVRNWVARLVCSQCGSREVDFVVAPRRTGGLGNEITEISGSRQATITAESAVEAGSMDFPNSNVFEMFVAHGGPDFWVRRTTWSATCARVVRVGSLTAPAPYFGNPSVLMDVYSLSGELKGALAQLPAPGTYKTWWQIQAPSWVSTIELRPLDDPAIGAALAALDRKRHKNRLRQ